jgi:hypothetical protein
MHTIANTQWTNIAAVRSLVQPGWNPAKKRLLTQKKNREQRLKNSFLLRRVKKSHRVINSNNIHCKKGSWFSLSKLPLAGNNLIIPARESLVLDIPAEDGKISNLFLQCK